ncbi:MAG: ribonuclease HI [Epulopiscium sp.]|nr:ribonuclease HI [Candidatus Epulonipiscium sp.]
MDWLEVYTDGACTNNQGEGLQPGGWAAVFIDGPSLSGGENKTTNNRMEMKAVIEALKNTPPNSNIRIYSDSAYVINCFKQNWIGRWEKNGWITSAKKPVENKELWMEMRNLERERNVEWVKVKGHSGNKWNEKVDKLAVEAIPNNKNENVEKTTTLHLSSREKNDLIKLLESNEETIRPSIKSILYKLKGDCLE